VPVGVGKVGWGPEVEGVECSKGRGGGFIGREEGFGDVGVLELNGKGVSLMLWCLCEIPWGDERRGRGVERVGLRRLMSEFCCVYAKGFRWVTGCWS